MGPRGDVANLYWPRSKDLRTQAAHRRRRMRRWAKAERTARDILLFSHGGCLDGVGAAVVTLRSRGQAGVAVAYCQPDSMQDALAFVATKPANGRTLMIADLSFNPVHFDKIVAACGQLKAGGWRIEWRDHHHKQWEGLDLAKLSDHLDVLTVNDDATESGASLQQQALAPDDDFLRRFAETVRDRDCWFNETPDSETLELAISRMGADPFTRHFLAADGNGPVVDAAIVAAATGQRKQQESISKALLSQVRIQKGASGSVGVIYGWLPKNMGLHQLLEDGHCDIALNVRPNGKMSARSVKGADVCHLVCRQFGGGGHPNASGADLGLRGVRYWWYVLRRGRVARVAEIMDYAVTMLDDREAPAVARS